MATPITTLLRDFMAKSIKDYDVLSASEYIKDQAMRSAGAYFAAGGDAAEVAAAEGAGEAVAGFGLWPILLLLIIVAVTLRFVEYMLANAVYQIPWVGGRLRTWVRFEFKFLDRFENWVLSWVEQQLRTMLHRFVAAVIWALGVSGILHPFGQPTPRTGPGNYATEGEIRHIQAEIRAVNARVNLLESQSTIAPLPGTVPSTMWQQIHHLENQQAAMVQDMHQFRTELTQTVTVMNHLEAQVQQIQSSVRGIRAVAVGWQAIEGELDQVQQTLVSFQATTQAHIQNLTNRQNYAEPLTLLLQPGIAGLRNLRKLEDNICQCPRFGGIPNELGTALAVYEFIENG